MVSSILGKKHLSPLAIKHTMLTRLADDASLHSTMISQTFGKNPHLSKFKP